MFDTERLLQRLSGESIAREVTMHFDLARESYELTSLAVENCADFERELVRFYQWMHVHTISSRTVWPDDIALGLTRSLVEAAYPGGLQQAYRNSRTGLGAMNEDSGLEEELRRIVREELKEVLDEIRGDLAPDVERVFLTMREAAEHVGTSERTVRAWISAGKLHGYRAGRLLRVRQDELDAFLARSDRVDVDERAREILRSARE